MLQIDKIMETKNAKIIYPELSYKLTGLLYETHNHLGKYRNEKQYADYFEGLLKGIIVNFRCQSLAPKRILNPELL